VRRWSEIARKSIGETGSHSTSLRVQDDDVVGNRMGCRRGGGLRHNNGGANNNDVVWGLDRLLRVLVWVYACGLVQT
jgi:hypothetical protein